MAEEIRRGRVRLSKKLPPSPRPIGGRWLDRFKTRHPEIEGIWTRQIESARFNATSYEGVKRWFDAVTELFLQHQYPPERVYNTDESGFAVGASQSSRALVNIRETSSWKRVGSRQEWITAIECVSAAGVAVPPLIIFKAKHTNTAWIPTHTPQNWRFSTSSSGWTSDSHGYEWLTSVFEPLTRPNDLSARRLLVMDGHSSHITANVIALCMESAIDLLVLPPHCSHLLQPLDVGVFAPLKRALASETDAALRVDSGRISRVEWTEMYIRARAKAITANSILGGWRGAGLVPLSPMTVLDKLPSRSATTDSPPHTPLEQPDLDLSLLHSSPPDGTELREANALLNSTLESTKEVPSSVQRYTERMTRFAESKHSENVTLRKQVEEQEKLLDMRKARKKGKRIALKGRFVFSTEEVLEIAKEAEAKLSSKKPRGRPHDLKDLDLLYSSNQPNLTTSISPAVRYAKIREEANVTIRDDTIRSILKRHYIFHWIATKRPLLQEKHAKMRLRWAKAHLNWSDAQWANVIWSDECSVERGSGKKAKWVWSTLSQKWEKDFVAEHPTAKEIRVMVWAAFYGGGRSNCFVMCRDQNAKKKGYPSISYAEALRDQLPLIYQPGMVFMQDSAGIHTSSLTKDWLREHGIHVLTWPPYSPDLNPIEHAWIQLKQLVYEIIPDVKTLPKNEATREALERALEQAWQRIPIELFKSLGESMRDRCQAVVDAKGWHTKY
ncbi:hypothetical protein B0A49_10136 [Cryomyces minteri]|uniref:DDE-1 domain-containing protein n=1 Tax=Cryomyces minteri TaxID=331657 RepID=A0A4U0WP48_9PEZI|nr:hypothetical protein B0A49_10136 [Cryomyces minteri]